MILAEEWQKILYQKKSLSKNNEKRRLEEGMAGSRDQAGEY